ncbi:MAG: NadR type nicotinamide-nucleotide adenylyltransferase [Marivirga sp.]|jgi:NadR type nicotinamide-nucleotide adenylyltransferase
MPKKIAIIGPESSGKSTLSKQLALHFNESFLPEYGRIYLETHGTDYIFDDLEKICRKMMDLENTQIKNASKFLFCDTDLLMMKVWYEVKFNRISEYLKEQLSKTTYDYYFICSPDLPWQDDPVRENPHIREMLYERYIQEVEQNGIPYTIINGNDRVEKAISVLEALF